MAEIKGPSFIIGSSGRAKVISTRACGGLISNHCNITTIVEIFFNIS
jgi:hypothetical protein